MNLRNLGFNEWFSAHNESIEIDLNNTARVVAVNKDNFIIRNDIGELRAEITGKMMYGAASQLDFPVVGDWVKVEYFDDRTFAILHMVLPRKSLLKRKSSGKNVDFQAIAANIEVAFIMQSLDANFNLRRLERYLTMIRNSNVEPILLLSKSDLVDANDLQRKLNEVESVSKSLQVIYLSNLNTEDIKRFRETLQPAVTYCLLGSSGVGKTTLLNNLLGVDLFETQSVREKDHRGKHTTSRRQLIVLENGALLIDTPGMRELGNFDVDTGLQETFDEISEIAKNCKFNDCSHTREKGCAVLQTLIDKVIDEKRYQNFIKTNKEAAYYERTYLEKRKRDKEFGKLNKSVMKNNVKKWK